MVFYGGQLDIQDGRQTNQPIPNLIGDNINVYWLDRFSLQSYSPFRPKAHQRLNIM